MEDEVDAGWGATATVTEVAGSEVAGAVGTVVMAGNSNNNVVEEVVVVLVGTPAVDGVGVDVA